MRAGARHITLPSKIITDARILLNALTKTAIKRSYHKVYYIIMIEDSDKARVFYIAQRLGKNGGKWRKLNKSSSVHNLGNNAKCLYDSSSHLSSISESVNLSSLAVSELSS